MRLIGAISLGACLLISPSTAQNNSAGLTGTVLDPVGVGIPGASAELRLVRAPEVVFEVRTDADGVYRFTELPAGAYTLKLTAAGFARLIARIQTSPNEQRSAPPLELVIGMCGVSHAPWTDHIRVLPAGERSGNLGGTVVVESLRSPPRLTGAQVSMICKTGQICASTKTNSKGEFLFERQPPGDYAVRVNYAGFYPLTEPGYKIREGLESVYFPSAVERCPGANCDPHLRPPKPLGHCE